MAHPHPFTYKYLLIPLCCNEKGKPHLILHLSNTDADSVQVILGERLYGVAVRAVGDAVGRNAVVLNQLLHDDVCTLTRQAVINLGITSLNVCIATNVKNTSRRIGSILMIGSSMITVFQMVS